MSASCPGPLIWYSVPDDDAQQDGAGALLECGSPGCGYLVIAGNFHDQEHGDTPLLREGAG